MSRLVDQIDLTVTGGSGLAGFEAVQEQGGYVTRYLRLEDRRAYEVGNGCGTCQFWFTRLEGANTNVGVDALRDLLTGGLTSVSDVAVEQFSRLLSDGRYVVLLMDVAPRLVEPCAPDGYFAAEQIALWGIDGFWGLPHHPKVPYYRLDDTAVGRSTTLFEFVVPMYPPTWLDTSTVDTYTNRLSASVAPTAVALSVLDIKQPAVWADDTTLTAHWCFAHYLLDGHHKLYAAAINGKPIRLLSFLAVTEGVSSEEDVTTLLRLL